MTGSACRPMPLIAAVVTALSCALAATPATAKPVQRREPDAAVLAVPDDEPRGAGPEHKAFAINLASYLEPITFADLPEFEPPSGTRVYITEFFKGGKQWYRARLGLFEDKARARKVMETLRDRFPQAWLARVSDAERLRARLGAEEPAKAPPRPAAETPAPETHAAEQPASEEALAAMADADLALRSENYDRAITLYTKVLGLPDRALHPQAREMLGLARERNGQLAHARAEYRKYLEEYPGGEDAARVRQRLDGLLTASKPDRERLRAGRRARAPVEWDLYGGASQFYRRNARVDAPGGGALQQSVFSSDINVTGRLRGDAFDVRTQITGGRDQDFLDPDDSSTKLNELFVDARQSNWGLATRVGRQTRSTGGVLGRFDGAAFGYNVTKRTRLNLVGGLPVERLAPGEISFDKYFYGLGLELGPYFQRVDLDAYAIEQRVHGLVDRRAVGAEARYLDASRSLFGSVDYDIYFRKLNTALVLANWNFKNLSSVNLSFGYRTTPVLTTSNALQGQSVDSIADLREIFTDEEIRALAEDRTTESRTVTFGATRPLSEKLLFTGQFTLSNLSGTVSSGGVEATESTGNEFFYNAQLVGSNLIKPGDITTLGLRYGDTSNSDLVGVNVNTRYPFGSMLRVNPKVSVNYRFVEGGQAVVRPSSRFELSWRRTFQLELELGGEWTHEDTALGTEDTLGYFISAGYRWDF